MATHAGRGQNLLRQLPRRWDETRFIDGRPGPLRRHRPPRRQNWWAGFNADDTPREVVLDALPAPARQPAADGPARATSASRPAQIRQHAAESSAAGGFIARFP